MKITVGYVHNGMLHAQFVDSLMAFLRHDSHNRRIFRNAINVAGSFLASNRNLVAREFLKGTSDYLAFIDTDMTFHPELVYGLLDDAEGLAEPAIVSALYFGYVAEAFSAVWLRRIPEGGYRTLMEVKPELQEVDVVGMGCCVIHREVFERVRHRESAIAQLREGLADDEWTWFGHDLVRTAKGWQRLGEDATFCARAQDAGIHIWGDGRLVAGHIKPRVENVATMMERVRAHEAAPAVDKA